MMILRCDRRGLFELHASDPSHVFANGVAELLQRIIAAFFSQDHAIRGPSVRRDTHVEARMRFMLVRQEALDFRHAARSLRPGVPDPALRRTEQHRQPNGENAPLSPATIWSARSTAL